MSQLSGNSGEWSEVFVLLMLLAYGKVPLADSDLNLLASQYLDVVEVRRSDKSGNLSFTIAEDGESIILNSAEIVTTRTEVKSILPLILDAISGGGKEIVIPAAEVLLARMRTYMLAAPSSDKTDLVVVVRDHRNGSINPVSFSIKSQIGTPASLLNASGATSFRYQVKGSAASVQNLGNLGRDPLQIIKRSNDLGVSICCGNPLSEQFRENLLLIDSLMPEIASEMLFGHFSGQASKMVDVVAYLAKKNPAKVRTNSIDLFYLQKVRSLLSDLALGMTAGKPWDGNYTSNSGYLIVTKQGKLASIMFSDQNTFRDYLLKNTRFERGSRERHKYGSIEYSADGSPFLDLNLQIRFSK